MTKKIGLNVLIEFYFWFAVPYKASTGMLPVMMYSAEPMTTFLLFVMEEVPIEGPIEIMHTVF